MNRRHLYIWNEIKETYAKSADLLEKYAEKLGTVGAAINYIKLKESRTGEEQQVLDGLDYIQRLMLEHEEYKEEVLYHVFTNKKLDFPMSDRLKKIWLDAANEVYQQSFITDLPSFLGIPDNTERYLKELKMKEQRARDTLILEEKDRSSAAKLLTEQGDNMLVRRDLSAKDEKLIKKMSYLSELIDVKHPPEIRLDTSRDLDPNFLRAQFKDQSAFGKSEGELYEENFIKMLFLNNCRPEEFDLEYWAENLNIFPHQLRSIFNYVSFPVVINNQAVAKLEFIESNKKKTVMDIIKENDKKEKEERNFNAKKEIRL